MKMAHIVSFLLVIVGGVNWGLVGIGMFTGSDLNIVHMILSAIGLVSLESIVYILVGLCAVWLLVSHKKDCKVCAA